MCTQGLGGTTAEVMSDLLAFEVCTELEQQLRRPRRHSQRRQGAGALVPTAVAAEGMH
jgi:hypothetical protein